MRFVVLICLLTLLLASCRSSKGRGEMPVASENVRVDTLRVARMERDSLRYGRRDSVDLRQGMEADSVIIRLYKPRMTQSLMQRAETGLSREQSRETETAHSKEEVSRTLFAGEREQKPDCRLWLWTLGIGMIAGAWLWSKVRTR